MNRETSAEMLLNYYYPELSQQWTVRYKGTFYRNYNADLMAVDTDTCEVELARDGFMQLLPDGFIADANALRGGGMARNYESLKQRRMVLGEAFAPFDTVSLRARLKAERKVSQLLDMKLTYILNQYFCIDIEAEQNPYVREVAWLLPWACRRRGDVHFVADLLRSIFAAEVETDMSHRHSETDSTQAWLPEVRFNILLSGLSREEYLRQTELLKPLAAFLAEWLLPFDLKARIEIKQHGLNPNTDENLILNYNTEL